MAKAKKENNMITLSALTSAAFKVFIKGEQYLYAVECLHNPTGVIGEGRPALKIGQTGNLYERFRSYLSLTTNLAAVVVPVKDAAKAERIIHHILKDYNLGREVFDISALEAFKEAAKAL